jgi:general secretion pathway protein A
VRYVSSSKAFLEHFGLERSPFSTTPDPAFAFATREHKAALAKIAYYTEERRGIFLLMGQIGTGKTTISQLALNGWRAQPDKFTAAHVTDPSPRTPAAFLRLVLASFGLATTRNVLDLKAGLRGFLVEQYKAGKTVALLIDEAQTIYPTNLETIQAMANEQTQKEKLIQIVLLAQPNFEYKLTHKPALRSRIAGGTTLNPLTLEDAIDLLRHRVDVAGGDFDTLFPPAVHKALYNATNGIPRDLCVLCDAGLVEAYSQDSKSVEPVILEATLKQLSFKGWGRDKK